MTRKKPQRDTLYNAHMTTELITVRDLLRYAVSRFTAAKLFFGHGSDNAWDEAAYLIPVSYTHLDVYKRQSSARRSLERGKVFLRIMPVY